MYGLIRNIDSLGALSKYRMGLIKRSNRLMHFSDGVYAIYKGYLYGHTALDNINAVETTSSLIYNPLQFYSYPKLTRDMSVDKFCVRYNPSYNACQIRDNPLTYLM